MLKNKFETLCRNFSEDEKLIAKLWKEIEIAHTQTNRYYHTLQHLEHIYKELETFRLTALLEFSIFYHDFVYDVLANDNEETSATFCEKCLVSLNVPIRLIEEITQLIHETKTHEASSSNNTLFLDADLAILGSYSKNYLLYIANVRKEYSIYDDSVYKKGRKKVVKKLLDKESIYLSDYFYKLYENKARKNLEQELKSLNL